MPISQEKAYHIIPHRMSSSQKRNSPTSLRVNKIWNLDMRRMSMSKLQSLSRRWRQKHHEQPLGIPGKAFTPSSPMEFSARWMFVTEVFVFKASASAWPKGKRHGSRPRLTSVRPCEIQMRQNSQFQTPRFQRTNPTGSRIQDKCRLQRCILRQYHANIPVESIPHHTSTTQNEFKPKWNSPTSLTVNKIWNLEMRRMSKSKLQSLSKSWRQRHHEQPLGIPGHTRPSPPHGRWNSQPGRCLSRKCSSSKLRLVPGRRESDMEVDQGWHLWDLMKYKGNTTLSFRLWVSKEQIPLDSGQMSFTEMHFQPISCQYPSRKHTTSYHTEWVQVKKKTPTSLRVNKTANWKCDGWAWADYKAFQKLATKTPWAATWNPGTHKAFTPSSPMELPHSSMLVTEVFVFKASASAWPKGKRHGSRSNLTSARPHEIQRRHNSQFPTFRFRVSKQQFPLDSGQMSLTQRCTSSQYHANIPVESHLESRERPVRPHRRWNCPAGRCLSQKCSSSKLRLVPGQRESDLEVHQGGHLWDVMKYKWDTTLSFRLWVSKEQFPLDSRQMWFTEMHFQPISCQYPSRKHTTSYHTEWVQVKKKHPLHWESTKLETGNVMDEHEQTTKPSKKLATKTPLAATWNPGTQKAFTPSAPMKLWFRLMLVTEAFVFKASARPWPKGKRHGSRLKSVPERIQFNYCQVFKQEWSSHV